MVLTSNLRVNGDRLWDSLMDMAQIGPGVRGGNNRQTLTDEDGEGRKLFQSWCEKSGLSMGVDTMGNMFFLRPGEDADADPVYMGSHLDTQPTGGKFDGVLGVLGGLEVMRTLNDMNIKTKRPIVVVNWTNEEGTRFAPAMLSSGVLPVSTSRTGPISAPTPKARNSETNWSASAGKAMNRSGSAKSMRCSSFISNRDQSLKLSTRISVLSRTVRGCGGCR